MPPADGICGYVHDSGWGKDSCCVRPRWNDHERCLWHADTPGKPAPEIAAALDDLAGAGYGASRDTERLDGAVLRGTQFGAISFDGCHLADADFTGSSVPWGGYPELEMPWAPYTDRAIRGPSFRDADLRGSDFSDSDFPESDFAGADLRGAKFHRAGLADAALPAVNARAAQFTEGFLRGVDFEGATLLDAVFTDVRMSGANLVGADAERATFIRTDLLETDLRGAALYAAVLSDIRLDDGTQFGDRCVYDFANDDPLPDRDTEDAIAQGYKRAPFKKASWTYRRLETVCRRNSLLDDARRFYVRGKDVRRKWYWYRIGLPAGLYALTWRVKTRLARSPGTFPLDEVSSVSSIPDPPAPSARPGPPRPTGRPTPDAPRPAIAWRWFRSASTGVVTRYGDDPIRLLWVAAVTAIGFAGVYAAVRARSLARLVADPGPYLEEGLALSLMAFAQRADPAAVEPILSTPYHAQMLLGYLFLALLVFILGRRATW